MTEPKTHSPRRLRLSHLLRPYWPTLGLALIAVLGETAADLAEPWPLKIVLDYVLQSKHMPDWLAGVVHRLAGTSQDCHSEFGCLARWPSSRSWERLAHILKSISPPASVNG